MNKFIIYLSGGITGMSLEECIDWRHYITSAIEDSTSKAICFDPTEKYHPDNPSSFDSELEVQNYELDMLRKSGLVIVNFNNPKSIGTACELAVASEYKIPIIGLNESGCELHPWLENYCNKVFNNLNELLGYITDYYIYYL